MTNDLMLIHTGGLDEAIRCAMCTNTMKSDRGCDGGCVIDTQMYEKVLESIADNLIIPSNATNGDVIKAVFPNVEAYHNAGYTNVHAYIGIVADITAPKKWWDAPYNEGDKNV